MSERTASGPQLWVLNSAGRLAVVDAATPIKSSDASELVGQIKAEADHPSPADEQTNA